MSLWVKCMLGYAALGCLFVGANARRWWTEHGVAVQRYELGRAGAAALAVCGVIADVLLWPHSFWIHVRQRTLAALYTRFTADWDAAVARTWGCDHRRTVDVWPIPGTALYEHGVMRKCRACWAIEAKGVWTPNLIPPPPERR